MYFIFYFDSTSDPPPKEVKKLIKRIVLQGKDLNIIFKKPIINDVERQMEDTECGIYSLYFIINLIKNKTPEDFLGKKISDKEMENLRKIYFNI